MQEWTGRALKRGGCTQAGAAPLTGQVALGGEDGRAAAGPHEPATTGLPLPVPPAPLGPKGRVMPAEVASQPRA